MFFGRIGRLETKLLGNLGTSRRHTGLAHVHLDQLQHFGLAGVRGFIELAPVFLYSTLAVYTVQWPRQGAADICRDQPLIYYCFDPAQPTHRTSRRQGAVDLLCSRRIFWRADAHVPRTEDFQSHLAMAGQRLGQSQEPAGKSHHRTQSGSGQTHRLCPENQFDHRPDDPAAVLRGSRSARPLHAAGTERPAAAALCLSRSSASPVWQTQQTAPLPAGVPPAAGSAQAGSRAGYPGGARHPVLGPRSGSGRGRSLRPQHHQQPGAEPAEEGTYRDPQGSRESGALLATPLPTLYGGQARHRRGHRPQAGASCPYPLQPSAAGCHRPETAEPQPAVQAAARLRGDPAGD